MAELGEYLAILILRTLGLSQDDVAGLVHCAKQTVVNADRWFSSCPHGEAVALVDDQRIKRLVNRDFPDMELTSKQLIKAGQITGDDILLHYGRVRPRADRAAGEATHSPEVTQGINVNPTYVKLLERHWDRLREQAVALHTQLSPLDIDTLFAAETCRKACNTFQSGSPLPLSHSWSQVIDAPLELRLSQVSGRRVAEVRLLVEKEFLFPHLLSHLQADFTEFTQFGDWKSRLAQLIEDCLERLSEMSRACAVSSGMYYFTKQGHGALSYHFPAFICQFIMSHPDSDIKPRVRIEPQPSGLYQLVAETWPAITLAVDTADHISRCQEVLLKQIKDNTRLQVWRRIYTDLTDLNTGASQWQVMLTTVIERGSFQGSCPLCQGYFAAASSPEM